MFVEFVKWQLLSTVQCTRIKCFNGIGGHRIVCVCVSPVNLSHSNSSTNTLHLNDIRKEMWSTGKCTIAYCFPNILRSVPVDFLTSLLLASFWVKFVDTFYDYIAFPGRLYRLPAIKCCKFDPISTLSLRFAHLSFRFLALDFAFYSVFSLSQTLVNAGLRKSFIDTRAYVIHIHR